TPTCVRRPFCARAPEAGTAALTVAEISERRQNRRDDGRTLAGTDRQRRQVRPPMPVQTQRAESHRSPSPLASVATAPSRHLRRGAVLFSTPAPVQPADPRIPDGPTSTPAESRCRRKTVSAPA